MEFSKIVYALNKQNAWFLLIKFQEEKKQPAKTIAVAMAINNVLIINALNAIHLVMILWEVRQDHHVITIANVMEFSHALKEHAQTAMTQPIK